MMRSPRKILVPTDLSTFSLEALEYAEEIASLFATEIVIVIGSSLWGEGVHVIGKARFVIHGILGMQFILQTYYPWPVVIEIPHILIGMAIASASALAAYALGWIRQ